ncbi:hypothetical protein NL676_030176 [Syzygium grande]|nr:hypothetical protein NL676_030176 [Syzygium grande]
MLLWQEVLSSTTRNVAASLRPRQSDSGYHALLVGQAFCDCASNGGGVVGGNWISGSHIIGIPKDTRELTLSRSFIIDLCFGYGSMVIKNGATKDSVTNEATTSRSLEVAKSPAVNENELDSNKSKRDEKGNLVQFHKLFSFADSTDTLLMVVGPIGAVGNDLSLPLMTVLFVQLINTFG